MPENRKQPSRLDPRKPLVLDTRELGRRAGSMRELHLVAPAPEGLGLADVVSVPVGAELDLDLRLESVMEGVLVTGTVHGPLAGECVRCLEPLGTDSVTVPLQELYTYPDDRSAPDDDEDVAVMEGDHLDLEPALRDAVVLALPLQPVCDPDCAGLCVECGGRLDDLPADHAHDTVDARWAQLTDLFPTRPQNQEH